MICCMWASEIIFGASVDSKQIYQGQVIDAVTAYFNLTNHALDVGVQGRAALGKALRGGSLVELR